MGKKKVFISTSSFGEVDPAPVNALANAGFEIFLNPFKRKLTKAESLNLFPGFDGLIAGLETLDEEVLNNSGFKVIARCGAGLSNVDLATARRLNILVYSTPEAPVTAVAELTLGAMLSLLRMVPQMNFDLHAGKWQKRVGDQLHGKTVAIIGYGRIGRKVGELLKAFQAKVVVVDPRPKGETGILSLPQALAMADIITVHADGQEQIIGPHEFSLMNDGVYVLNASRGEVINEAALVQALRTKKVAGAWCDVFNQEPYEGPLREFPQVILTPHAASYTRECRQEMEMQAAQHVIAGFAQLKGHAP